MIEHQLWSKECEQIWNISHPGKPVWVMLGFFSTIEESRKFIENRAVQVDCNGHQEFRI